MRAAPAGDGRIRAAVTAAHAVHTSVFSVHLVRRDIYKAAHAAEFAGAFEEIDRAHNVRLVGIGGVGIPRADDRLRREVKDDLRLRLAKRPLRRGGIAHIAEHGTHVPLYARERI